MAVTITRADLRDALRLADDQDTTDEIDRILAYATEVATKLVPVCPDVVHNESVVRLASYLFDQPSVSRAQPTPTRCETPARVASLRLTVSGGLGMSAALLLGLPQ